MIRISAAAAALIALATPALAHHPLAGAPMTTFTHGLLSGVGHPILGFDHLFFIVAVGIASVFTGRALLAPLAFVVAMLAGVMLVVNGVVLPMVEPVIAASLLILGALIARGQALSLRTAAALFAVLGVFHGWAFGETLAGNEGGAAMAIAAGYLIGLAATQWAIAVAAGFAISKLWNAATADAVAARVAGGVVAGVGAFLVLEVAEGAAFAALGIG